MTMTLGIADLELVPYRQQEPPKTSWSKKTRLYTERPGAVHEGVIVTYRGTWIGAIGARPADRWHEAGWQAECGKWTGPWEPTREHALSDLLLHVSITA